MSVMESQIKTAAEALAMCQQVQEELRCAAGATETPAAQKTERERLLREWEMAEKRSAATLEALELRAKMYASMHVYPKGRW